MIKFVNNLSHILYYYDIKKTPLHYNERLTKKYNNNIFLKREDLQITNSYKIRPAMYHFIKLKNKNIKKKVIIASAGNFSSGIAYCSYLFKMNSIIFIPTTTPTQKVNNINYYGKDYIKLRKDGNNFDNCLKNAKLYCKNKNNIFLHPYDCKDTILANATIGYELIHQLNKIDYILVPIGGGGLIGGLLSYIKNINPNIKIIGCQTFDTNAMYNSLYVYKTNKKSNKINTFIDGISVQQPGLLPYLICKKYLDDIILISNNMVCKELIDCYNYDKIILEPAGAVSLAVLSKLNIKNKNVICLLSGSNNDLLRYKDIYKLGNDIF